MWDDHSSSIPPINAFGCNKEIAVLQQHQTYIHTSFETQRPGANYIADANKLSDGKNRNGNAKNYILVVMTDTFS